MKITSDKIDHGRAFDWGRASALYARWRDIYPPVFYEKLLARGVGTQGQHLLDLGTGTGVIPRNMHSHGAMWVGADISPEQIAEAKRLSIGSDIEYIVSPAERLEFPPRSFDGVTACQCFWYFDHERLEPKLYDFLKPDGKLLILYMAWLPYEDELARRSEELVLKYNPDWSGAGETPREIEIPDVYRRHFEQSYSEVEKIKLRFTRESWHGRMKACRGVGASLDEDELMHWDTEHLKLLKDIAPDEFEVAHYIAIAELRRRK